VVPTFLAPRHEAFDHVFDARAAPADIGEPFAFLGLEIADDVIADFVDGGIKVFMLGRGIGVEAGADDMYLGPEDVAFLVMGAGLAELDVAHDGGIASDELIELGDALVYVSGDRGSQGDVRTFDADIHGEKWLEIGNQSLSKSEIILT